MYILYDIRFHSSGIYLNKTFDDRLPPFVGASKINEYFSDYFYLFKADKTENRRL